MIKNETNIEENLTIENKQYNSVWDVDAPQTMKPIDNSRKKISKILKDSVHHITENIKSILIKNNCRIIPSAKDTTEQTFTYEGVCYVLSDPIIVEEIQHVITDINSAEVYEKLMSSRKTELLIGLLDTIVTNVNDIRNPLILDYITTVGPKVFEKLIINVLESFLRQELIKKSKKFIFLQASTGIALGQIIYDVYMDSKYLYKNMRVFLESENYSADKNKIKAFIKRTPEELKLLLEALRRQEPLTELRDKYQFACDDFDPLNDIRMSLEIYSMDNNIISLDLDLKLKNDAKLSENYLNLGIEIIYYLRDICIVELIRDNKEANYLKINKSYEMECFTSATHFKPLLQKDVKHRTASFNTKDQFKILVSNFNKTIPNKKHFQIQANKKLYELLDCYDDVKYQINHIGSQGLENLIDTFADQTDFKNINIFMNPIFNFEIEKLQLNN